MPLLASATSPPVGVVMRGAELALLFLPPSTYVIPRVLRKPSRFGDWRECERKKEAERVLNSENVNTNTAA